MSRRLPVPSPRALMVGSWVAGFAVFGLLSFLMWAYVDLYGNDEVSIDDRSRLAQENAEEQARIDDLEVDLALAIEQIRALGQEPVIDPADLAEGERPSSEERTVDLVQALVEIAVPTGLETYCAPRNGCTSPPAPPLPPLPPIEPRDGRDGADGETPSDERLIGLITPLIPPAVKGDPGVGVASFTCGTPAPVEFTFTVTLTDGTAQTFTCGGINADPDPAA